MGEGRVLFVGVETLQVIKELKPKADIKRGSGGNASLVEMQIDGRWIDSRMPSRYVSEELAKNRPD